MSGTIIEFELSSNCQELMSECDAGIMADNVVDLDSCIRMAPDEVKREFFQRKDSDEQTILHKGWDIFDLWEFLEDYREYLDLSAVDRYGNTALHYAIGSLHVEAVEFLLDLGVDASINDAWNMITDVSIDGRELSDLANSEGISCEEMVFRMASDIVRLLQKHGIQFDETTLSIVESYKTDGLIMSF